MSEIIIESREEIEGVIEKNDAVIIYFSTPQCGVCKVLKPKIIELVDAQFPKMVFTYVNCEKFKDVAASYSVFTVPTIVVFLEGKEAVRKARYISVPEFAKELERPYGMMFE